MRRIKFLLVGIACSALGCSAGPAHDWPESCPDPGDTDVWYSNESWAARGQCSGSVGDVMCTPPLEDFGPDHPEYGHCGCGCIPEGYELSP